MLLLLLCQGWPIYRILYAGSVMVTMVTIDMVWISLLRQLLIIIWKRLFRRVKMKRNFLTDNWRPCFGLLLSSQCVSWGKVGISCILISDEWKEFWITYFWRTAGIWYPPNLIQGIFQIYEQRKEGCQPRWGLGMVRYNYKTKYFQNIFWDDSLHSQV